MTLSRFRTLTSRYPSLRIAVFGDFCLDRYLEIDPAKKEVSIETGLPVHNVVRVRAQPGGAGTILNNLAALGIGTVYPIGFAGEDGEGFELCRAMERLPGVRMEHFIQTNLRRTFTYCKPLLMKPGSPPAELNRFDSKNWTPTPDALQVRLADALRQVAPRVNAIIVLDQVDKPATGVITRRVLAALRQLSATRKGAASPKPLILADSRRGLKSFPPAVFKMNAAELAAMTGGARSLPPRGGRSPAALGESPSQHLIAVKKAAPALARTNGHAVFVTLADQGIIGAAADGQIAHVPALPVYGPIDVVGAGDAVSANLAAALAAGSTMLEAIELANAAASVVIHKMGTTGTASVAELVSLLLRRNVQRKTRSLKPKT